MSMAMISPSPINSSRELDKITEPPLATPVSMMTWGLLAQFTSCIATMSGGIWMIGRPSHVHWYE